jgi:HK97 family phage portal protein
MSLLSFFGLSPGPTDDFWYGPVGTQTVAGVRVDENIAMTYSACWAATRLLSTSGGMLPLKLMRKLPGGGSEPHTDDPRYSLVHDAPNLDMPSMMWRASRIAQQVNRGNCYSEIEYSRGGQVLALNPIDASRIPKENIRRGKDGRLVYFVNENDGTKTPLRDFEVLHVPSPMSDVGIIGKGVVEHARMSIGFGIATETQGAAYFGNGARPLLVIKGGKFKSPEERAEYRRTWMQTHGGPQNNGLPAMLPPEADITALSFSAEDSQFLSTRQHNTEEIARWYGVPPHLIGHLLRSTHNNIEHQSLEFVKYSLMSWLVLWEQELNRKLLTPEERKTLFFRHNVDGLERGDLLTRTNALKEQFFNGKITLNEWRALDDENPVGPLGDIHFVQQAMIPLEFAAKGPQQPEAPKDEPKDEPDDESGLSASLAALTERLSSAETVKTSQIAAATLEVVEQVVRVMLDRESKDALEASKKPASFLKWMDGFYSDHTTRMEKALAKPVKAYLLARGRSDGIDDATKQAVAMHVAAGREALLQAASVPAEQFGGAVEACVSNWNRKEITNYLGGHDAN